LITYINTTRKWPGKRRNPSLEDSNERKSLTVCYTHKYVRLRQETGPVTTRDNEQETDNSSFAGQLTTVTPSLGNNYKGPQGTHIHIHRWGELFSCLIMSIYNVNQLVNLNTILRKHEISIVHYIIAPYDIFSKGIKRNVLFLQKRR
jgi:hypothetical protein